MKKASLKLTEDELKDSNIKRHVRSILDLRFKRYKHKPFVEISPAEYEIIKPMVLPWERYAKNRKELKSKKEIGKYKGKRIVLK